MALQVAVVVLGLATYVASFGPMLTVTDSGLAGLTGDVGLVVPVAVLAGLLAAAGLLPKAKNYAAVVAVVAVLGSLLAIELTITKGDMFAIGWALWLVLAFTIVQAIAAIGVLLLDAGVVTAPTPRRRYDPYAQYGLPPGGGYYGQPGHPGQPGGHPYGPQHSGYPPYGGYPAGPPPGPSSGGFGAPSAAPSTGGFGTGPQHQQGPPTPPTGFPRFGSSSAGGAATGGQSQQPPGGQGEQAQGGQGEQASSSAPSGPTQP